MWNKQKTNRNTYVIKISLFIQNVQKDYIVIFCWRPDEVKIFVQLEC
jgi:predicted NACHT family NTPase